MRKYKPTLLLSFGLVSLTMALSMTAYILGLMPDGYKTQLESRAKVAESIAVQVAGAVNRKDSVVVLETLNSLVDRNGDVLSAAIRRSNGTTLYETGDHNRHWIASKDGNSTPTHVHVPLLGKNELQGTIEISFSELKSTKRIFGIPASLLMFLGFITASGFIGYFFLLRRALRQLDPTRVIPERVQKSFDTLTEGVVIVDERKRIMLVNASFQNLYSPNKQSLVGQKINNLPWRMVDGRAIAGGYPWHEALSDGTSRKTELLSLRCKNGEIFNFEVNATVIAGEKDQTIGAIITLADMTNLQRSKDDLEKTANLLELNKQHVAKLQNELDYVVQHDTLTGCMNRKAFFLHIERTIDTISNTDEKIYLIMLDIDGFKRINTNFGPGIADGLIRAVAATTQGFEGTNIQVSHFGGGEFCISCVTNDQKAAAQLAGKIREALKVQKAARLPNGSTITLGISITAQPKTITTASDLVHQASRSLAQAKSFGRNKTVDIQPATVQHDEDDKSAQVEAATKLRDEKPQFVRDLSTSIEAAKRDNRPIAVAQITVGSWYNLVEGADENSVSSFCQTLKHEIQLTLREHDHVCLVEEQGEVLVCLNDIDKPEDAHWILNRLMSLLERPFQIGDRNIFISCKAGFSTFPENATDPNVLIRQAGIAMRRTFAKHMFDSVLQFCQSMLDSSSARLDIESGIREALRDDAFELFFQPIVNIQTGALSSAEGLLRCNHKSLDHVRIDQIIDVAEGTSLIAEIDMWVFKTATAQMQRWCDMGLELPRVSINLSATQFANPGFIDRIFKHVKNLQFSPSRIQVEVTESAEMSNVEAAAPQLKKLQQLGCLIALDDFGTGQASLSYLQRLHPDVIKIDRSFITDVHTNHGNATLVSATTVMAHCLGLKVVVEGVEEREELDFLRETGCDEVQGYLISKPMSVEQMNEWLSVYVSERGVCDYVKEISVQADVEQEASQAA